MLIEFLCVGRPLNQPLVAYIGLFEIFGDTKRMTKSDVDDNGNMSLLMKPTPQPFLLSKVYQLIFPSIE